MARFRELCAPLDIVKATFQKSFNGSSELPKVPFSKTGEAANFHSHFS